MCILLYWLDIRAKGVVYYLNNQYILYIIAINFLKKVH